MFGGRTMEKDEVGGVWREDNGEGGGQIPRGRVLIQEAPRWQNPVPGTE